MRPFVGIRSKARPTGPEAAARALAVRLKAGSYLSHSTAAAIWHLPLPSRLERDRRVHVTTPSPDLAVRARGVAGHRTRRPPELRTVRGLIVCDPVRVWVDLAAKLRVDELVELGDALVCPVYRADGSIQPGLATLAMLRQAVDQARHRRGVRRLGRALAEIRVGSQSPGETRLRLEANRLGLDEPELNARITGPTGRFLARGDLVYRRARVVVEYEGDHHRTDPKVFQNDIRRRERLEDAGWRVLRVTRGDLTAHRSEFVARLERLLVERTPR
ncbi:DUF559 domain-containing protein [Frondihabitans cladoniiphilus]|uniref:DUF559 domain-containing protein n=1 Tax=Frondihabitans cladoniiphilus TaxID=715785 RepID=A0ABP8VRZ0_9MICO